MEVVGADVGACNIEQRNALGFDVDNAVLVLYGTLDEHETIAGNHDPVALKDVWSEDDP